MPRALLALALVIGLAAFLGRPGPALPEGAGASWAAFAETRLTPEGPVFPDTLRSLDGRTVTLTGFATPLGWRTGRSLLSPYPSGCPFCAGGDPRTAVALDLAAPPGNGAVTVRGTLALDPSGSPLRPLYALRHAALVR